MLAYFRAYMRNILMCQCTHTLIHHTQEPEMPETSTYITFWQSSIHLIHFCQCDNVDTSFGKIPLCPKARLQLFGKLMLGAVMGSNNWNTYDRMRQGRGWGIASLTI